jgi:hypothetical protein
MNSNLPAFRAPSAGERAFNRIFGFAVGLGLDFSYNYLLQVRGRKSGKTYSTPIGLQELSGGGFWWPRAAARSGCVNAEAARRSYTQEGEVASVF